MYILNVLIAMSVKLTGGWQPVHGEYRGDAKSRHWFHPFENFHGSWSGRSSKLCPTPAQSCKRSQTPSKVAKAAWDGVASSRNARYAPKALQQARLVRLRSRKLEGYSYQGQAPGRATCAIGPLCHRGGHRRCPMLNHQLIIPHQMTRREHTMVYAVIYHT